LSYPKRLVVMVSGNGSNLQALIDAIACGGIEARIVLVLSSNSKAKALDRARAVGIPSLSLPPKVLEAWPGRLGRDAYDEMLASLVFPFEPDYVLMLGWMRLVGIRFISRFPGKIINLHPALPGAFPGTEAIEKAWFSYMKGEIATSGAMIHYVPDEGVDSGPVIDLEEIDIGDSSSLEEFEKAMHELEHRLVIRTVRTLTGASALDNRLPSSPSANLKE
jgi:phosphoribosylglycinamide formyltransferase-1